MTDSEVTRRSDGERTHGQILDVATRLASIEGLEGLTIGRLAKELGVSKSGVHAHFGSKEQLQLETIEAAQKILDREVIGPTMEVAPGIDRLQALCDRYLSYVERLVFPGGCFFSSLLAEMDGRTGRFHEMARDGAGEWLGLIRRLAAEAQQRGQLRPDADLDLLTFSIDAHLEAANYYYVLLDEPAVIDRSRRAIAALLEPLRL